MEYKRFLSVMTLLAVAILTIYVGCLRSYAIYFFESSQSNPDSFRSRKISRSSDLESIHEMNDENRADSTMHSISELSESADNVDGKSYERSYSKNIRRQRAFNERALEELAKGGLSFVLYRSY
uniref:Uncharacterized protein n=1 Tax=Parascaris equorum TaxID=6256 RepID=A0A914S4A5_PAREQ